MLRAFLAGKIAGHMSAFPIPGFGCFRDGSAAGKVNNRFSCDLWWDPFFAFSILKPIYETIGVLCSYFGID